MPTRARACESEPMSDQASAPSAAEDRAALEVDWTATAAQDTPWAQAGEALHFRAVLLLTIDSTAQSDSCRSSPSHRDTPTQPSAKSDTLSGPRGRVALQH